jgi:hypothetical protein
MILIGTPEFGHGFVLTGTAGPLTGGVIGGGITMVVGGGAGAIPGQDEVVVVLGAELGPPGGVMNGGYGGR